MIIFVLLLIVKCFSFILKIVQGIKYLIIIIIEYEFLFVKCFGVNKRSRIDNYPNDTITV